MKLCKLKLKNLNSFREEIVLDFENSTLADASLVAITGPTGAGKTTLLDAICVALYGNTPRLSGTGSQHPRHLISLGEDEGSAEVHFEVNGTRYCATWSVTRRGSRKGRLICKGQLICAEDGELISDKLAGSGKSLGSSQNTVSEEVTALLGLDFDAFKRSVMLAQGEFAAFLKAKNEERRTILEATAGIAIYDELKKVLNKKVGEVEVEHAAVLQKLGTIPEVSREQLAEAESEFGRLQAVADALDAKSQHIQAEKAQEAKRTEEFAKLQSSQERQETLLNQQPVIEALEGEQARAALANRLLPEKQAFDTAKSELQKATGALRGAETELANAQAQSETHQADFDLKDEAYQAAKTGGAQKAEAYRDAKSDIASANMQFQFVEEQGPRLQRLDEEIDTLSAALRDNSKTQATLKAEIGNAETFLAENPLPLDSRQRHNRASALLTEHQLKQDLLAGKLDAEATLAPPLSGLKAELSMLQKKHATLLARKDNAADKLAAADAELNALQAEGSLEEWGTRKQHAVDAQPIAQKYEVAQTQLSESENCLHQLREDRATLNTQLEKLTEDLASQSRACRSANEAVAICDAERETALLASPINQLRQHLHSGEPCRVCGATEHPYAGKVEHESEERQETAKNALDDARARAKAEHERQTTLEQKQIHIEQAKSSSAEQIEAAQVEIEKLIGETELLFEQWQEIYPDTDLSSTWVGQQIKDADTAMENLHEAREAHTQAGRACETALQQLDSCDKDIGHKQLLLNDAEQNLREVTDAIEDLKVDIADNETRFWELLPDAFQGVGLKKAVNQFSDRIEAVEACADKLSTKQNQLETLNANIRANRRELESAEERHEELQAEIKRYQSEGEAFLNDAREKTDGLETEPDIDTAIAQLDATIQAKADERDEAEQRLQESSDRFIEKQANYRNCQDRQGVCHENFGTARDAYFDKLSGVGFYSPEAHAHAFREEARMQQIAQEISAYTQEKHRLEVDIAELRTRFEETPFDPQALARITEAAEEVDGQIQEAQQEIGAQRNEIDELRVALSKREALDDKVRAASDELERWNSLQEAIPRNDLRDFALDIMFKQVSRIANAQLKYLTSERYQLKVESIGKLTVLDRWNANEERPVETLSGGESFLTSLALALALSELSRGRAQLNSLFLDEGFGTLDSETLDIAIAALEGLRMRGRSIFLISHIQELTRRLPVKINVKKQGDGSSSIEIRG